MKLYAKTATIPGGGKGFVFTGQMHGPSWAFPGAWEVDFASALGQLAHGFTRSEIRTDATTEDAQLCLGEPITLPTAAAVTKSAFLTLRTDGEFQPRAAGSDEGVNAIALETTTAAGAALALPFAQTLRDPRLATITTSAPAPGGAFALCPEMTVDLNVKAGISLALFGFVQVSLPAGSGVEVALFLRQAGSATFAEVAAWPRRRAENGAASTDAIGVPVPLGDVVPGAAITATGVATVQLHWRAISGSPAAVGLLRSFGASSTG